MNKFEQRDCYPVFPKGFVEENIIALMQEWLHGWMVADAPAHVQAVWEGLQKAETLVAEIEYGEDGLVHEGVNWEALWGITAGLRAMEEPSPNSSQREGEKKTANRQQ